MDTHSRMQELANNSEIENSRNKSHAKISEFKVVDVVHLFMLLSNVLIQLCCLINITCLILMLCTALLLFQLVTVQLPSNI